MELKIANYVKMIAIDTYFVNVIKIPNSVKMIPLDSYSVYVTRTLRYIYWHRLINILLVKRMDSSRYFAHSDNFKACLR